jgi:hypothetical protein
MLKEAIAAFVVTLTGGDNFIVAPHEWYWVEKSGYRYRMPPLECRVGETRPYKLVELPQAEMTARWGGGGKGEVYGRFETDEDGSNPIIYVAAELPAAVALDTLAHELAHLRGCFHWKDDTMNHWEWSAND